MDGATRARIPQYNWSRSSVRGMSRGPGAPEEISDVDHDRLLSWSPRDEIGCRIAGGGM